jgi:hypothetical protein
MSRWTSWSLKMGPIRSPETSVRNQPTRKRTISQPSHWLWTLHYCSYSVPCITQFKFVTHNFTSPASQWNLPFWISFSHTHSFNFSCESQCTYLLTRNPMILNQHGCRWRLVSSRGRGCMSWLTLTTINVVTTCNPLTGQPGQFDCSAKSSPVWSVWDAVLWQVSEEFRLAWRENLLFLVNDLKLHNLPFPVYKCEPLNQQYNHGVLCGTWQTWRQLKWQCGT